MAGSADKTLRLWDLETFSCLAVLTGHRDSVSCCSLYAGWGSFVLAISGSIDETLKVWEVISVERTSYIWTCRHTLAGHVAGVLSCAAVVQGTGGDAASAVVLSGSYDSTIKVWDIPSLPFPWP